MKIVDKIAWILVLIGALNWGLVGFLNFDLVAALLGTGSWLSMIVYDFVGLSAVWCIIYLFSNKKMK